MAREAEFKKQRVFNTGNGVAKPVWSNANRVNQANQFVPRPVQLNVDRPNINSVTPNINTGRTNVNSVRPRVSTNEKLHKENEHLKQTYKDLYDSIKKTQVQTKDHNDSLIAQINSKTVENDDLKAQIQEKLPKVRESVFAKPHHVIAPGSSRNSSKESYGSNDMAHNYYLEEAKKKKQDKNRNLKPRERPSARTHHYPNICTPKPKSNNQTSKNWPVSKSSEETLKAVQKADHARNPM
ncbi:hypothetical protein Tco_1289212 [Tanacetum coccineum]